MNSDGESERGATRYEIHIAHAEGLAIGDGAQAAAHGPAAGRPFQAPPLPAHFVPRPEISGPLLEYLLAAGAPAGTLAIRVVHGLGGIGKSVLVAALAHDPAVRERFPDGTLWVDLGQEPELLSLQMGWIQALHDYSYHPTTVEAALAHLRTLLYEKACLLVVDDAWQTGHVRAFLAGGPACRVLVTTSRADLAEDVGATLYALDVMTPAQSQALLARRLGRPLSREEGKVTLRLARRVGYLPLALELAAARAARGVDWESLCSQLEQEVARLEALEGPRRRRTQAGRLEASLALSVSTLKTEDEAAWASFARLGILPEDTTIAALVTATLWDMAEDEAAEVLELLWNDALLLPGAPVRVRQRDWPAYRLHDLLHNLARQLLTTPVEAGGLGLALSAVHRALLDGYRNKTAGGRWSALPDDGYIYEHLAWHMEEARAPELLSALLHEETAEGRNAWYEARERLGQTAGYLSDVRRAWALAGDSLALAARYALLSASLNSLAVNIPPELLRALVAERLWTPAQGLAYARAVSDSRQCAEALAGLAPLLPLELLADALAAAGRIANGNYRAVVLDSLGRRLPPELVPAALAAARAIAEENPRAWALAALAPCAAPAEQPAILAESLATAAAIPEGESRARTLLSMLPHWPEEERAPVLAAALATARALGKEKARARTLAALAPYLAEPDRTGLWPEILAVARGLEQDVARARTLASLAALLPAADRPPIVAEALAAARAVVDAAGRAQALVAAAWPSAESDRPVLLSEALAAAGAVQDERNRAGALAAVARHLPAAAVAPALAAALAAARTIPNGDKRAQTLAILAPHLPPAERAPVLAAALAAGRAIEDADAQARTLAALAPYLPPARLPELVAAAGAIHDPRSRAWVLAALGPHLPPGLLPQALSAVGTVADEDDRALATAALAPLLPDEMVRPALAAARAIREAANRSRALAALAPRLPEADRAAAWEEALRAARAIEKEGARSRALAALAPELPPVLLAAALAAAREMQDGAACARVLAALAPRAAPDVAAAARAAAAAILDPLARTQTLAVLLPALPEAERLPLAAELLAAARAAPDQDGRAQALAALVPALPAADRPALLAEALALARAIDPTDRRSAALERLAGPWAQWTAADPAAARAALLETLPLLAARTRTALCADLRALAPVAAAVGEAGAMEQIVAAIQDVGRWWP